MRPRGGGSVRGTLQGTQPWQDRPSKKAESRYYLQWMDIERLRKLNKGKKVITKTENWTYERETAVEECSKDAYLETQHRNHRVRPSWPSTDRPEV